MQIKWRKHVPRRGTAGAEVLKRGPARVRREASSRGYDAEVLPQSDFCAACGAGGRGLNLVHPENLFTPFFFRRVWSGVAEVRGAEEGRKEKKIWAGRCSLQSRAPDPQARALTV